MSLDFSVEKMRNYNVLTTLVIPAFTGETTGKEYPEQRKWHPITEALIWATMPVGLGSITEKNWIEFYHRLYMVERLTGAYLRRSDNNEFNYITPVEVYMHIGLHTNASNKTKKQFFEDIMFGVARDVLRTVEKAPETYERLGFATMDEARFQEKQRFETIAEGGPLDKLFDCPLETDENIISTTVD